MALVQFTGNVGKDPVMKTTKNGKQFATFSVADNVGWGENKRTEWYTVKVWGQQADFCVNYIRKGSKVDVCGSLEPYEFDGDNGPVRVNEVKAYDVQNVGPKVELAEAPEADEAPAPSKRRRRRAKADASDDLEMPTV